MPVEDRERLALEQAGPEDEQLIAVGTREAQAALGGCRYLGGDDEPLRVLEAQVGTSPWVKPPICGTRLTAKPLIGRMP